ncbi:MAG: ABC transporter ATP-binding protein [Chloroflexi bacterium]|nr:ABC transporter ATP-binding protein [Chloroflexota bacterium]
MPESILIAEDLTKTYPMNGVTVHALKGVNLQIESHEFVAIVGPSGCGKSTLLSLLGGLMAPSSGRVFLKGKDLATLRDKEKAKLRRVHLGFIFQSFELLSDLTAAENVAFPMVLAEKPEDQRQTRVLELLDRVGLSSKADYLPDELSAGQKQRVAIARALANSPDIILADEPTGNLDSATAAEVMELLADLHRESGLTLVIVTHSPEDAARAQRVVRIRDGLIES